MAYIVPSTIVYPPAGDAVGVTWVGSARSAAVYPNDLAAPAAPVVPVEGQIWPRGALTKGVP